MLVDVFGPETEPFYTELSDLKGVDLQRMDFEE